MTPEELAPVWAAYWAEDPDALEVLVREFLPLANYLARRSLSKAPAHQDAEDIHSYAHHGLLDAIAKFRPDGGAKFETYATKRISGSIMDGQRSQDPLTRSSRRSVKSMEAAVEQFWAEHGRAPTIEEISVAADMEIVLVRHALVDMQSMNASIEHMAEQSSDAELHTEDEAASSQPTQTGEVDMAVQLAEVGSLMAQRLAHMPGRERTFTLLYYCEDLSMAQAAGALDIGSDWCNRTRGNVLVAIRS